ncbi:hypothetical protein HGP14_30275 [Rhizobium sp. P32RR-XVIII]|uniref:DUF7482 domain-containing protein n=1 Tax=Rhizobium sp. P32RR-XVIII TaxID=2726738 RepID=UPI001456C312|nr:hypothetical protein [Rhizobium sp. P32RR-XVIII]NLS07562.1 hypothetical protein [Rhizobium sp. P32RR-XVIII]
MKDHLHISTIPASILFLAGLCILPSVVSAEVINRGSEGSPLSEIRPAPKSIYPDQYAITAQPSPSEVDSAFLGPVLLMKSAVVDLETGTATLPLRKGKLASGETVWSILTDVTDENLAKLHGVPFSPKLAYGMTGKATRRGHVEQDGSIVFQAGKVNFSPEHVVMPGDAPDFFPPKSAKPGSVGDADYSPLVALDNAPGVVFNMPMVAFDVSADELDKMCDGNLNYGKVEDKVVKICPRDGTVTLKLTLGYTFGKPIFYLSTEANDEGLAALEGATYTPALKDLPFALEDASQGEAAERLYAFVNGPTGIDNPFRQGLDSALSDKGSHGPLNVLGGIPTINLDYSPMWRVFPVKWTADAIEKGYRTKMTDAIAIEDAGERGIIESIAGGKPKPVGFVVNCPVVYRVN